MTIRPLGYPTENALKTWHREYEQRHELPAGYVRLPRYSQAQKERAVEHYLEHGRCITATTKLLGYPSRSLLSAWLQELHPQERMRVVGRSQELAPAAKQSAVVALCMRPASAQAVAEDLGVSRGSLYKWKNQLLDRDVAVVWVIPLLIGIGWLRGSEDTRKTMLVAAASGLLALLVNQVIALAWSHPRPFMIGLGHTLVPHVADSSFPSDHLTLWWAVASSLMLQRGPRIAGMALALLGVPIAWARIYLGVHFPFDMLGAMAVAALSACLTLFKARWYLEPSYRLATRIHHRTFGSLIALGWVRE